MPSRPMTTGPRVVTIDGRVLTDPKPAGTRDEVRLAIDIGQSPRESRPAGTFRLTDGGSTMESIELGVLQTADKWVSLSARVRLRPSGEERSAIVIIELADPFVDGRPRTVTITLDGQPHVSGVLQ